MTNTTLHASMDGQCNTGQCNTSAHMRMMVRNAGMAFWVLRQSILATLVIIRLPTRMSAGAVCVHALMSNFCVVCYDRACNALRMWQRWKARAKT